jgi:uncharacterized protein
MPVKRLQEIHNDTVINAASLLKEPVGNSRLYGMHLDRFELDDDLVASNVEGEVRLIRLAEELLLDATVSATVELECDRCLRAYDQPVSIHFSAQYEPTIDVITGRTVSEIDDEEERFSISDNHEVDMTEPLRQELIVGLPMVARCGRDCPGPLLTTTKGDVEIDDRLAALERLLKEQA